MNKVFFRMFVDLAVFVFALFLVMIVIGYVVLVDLRSFAVLREMTEGAFFVLAIAYAASLPAFLAKIKTEGLVARLTLLPWNEIKEVRLSGRSKYTRKLVVLSNDQVETVWLCVFEDPNVFLEEFCSNIDWLENFTVNDSPIRFEDLGSE